MTPSAVSLFAGCGGDTLGLVRAGFSVPWFSENWRPAIRSHLENYPDSRLIGEEVGGDIRSVPDGSFDKLRGSIDLLFAGFPCQGFSHAGKKDPNDPRNRLFWEFVRATRRIQPRWIVGENVPGLLHRTTDDGKTPVANVIVEAFEEMGYRMAPPFVLDAADFGVSQRRRRVFFVGSRAGLPFCAPRPLTRLKHPALRGFLNASLKGALPVEPASVSGGIKTWIEASGGPSGVPHPYLVEKIKSGLLSYSRRISPYHVEVVDLDSPAKTIHSGYAFQPRLFPAMRTPSGFFLRTFFPAELARIQGFPSDYRLSGTPKEQIVQIGNAVPPALVQAVVKQVGWCDDLWLWDVNV